MTAMTMSSDIKSDLTMELAMCCAWAVVWLLGHWLAHVPAMAIQRFVKDQARIPRQCGAYLRRLCRGQVFCVMALAGAGKLMLHWKSPEDLIFSFTWEHQMLFSMAAGHWMVSFWEDLQCRSFLAGGLDNKALPRVRDPAQLLLKGYSFHHAAAAVGYMALLHCQRISAVGTLGLLFELPVLLLNRRELLRLLWQRRWAERSAITEHWRFVYIFFLTSRGAAFALYAYALAWWQQQLANLDIMETCLLHSMAIVFALLNYAYLSILDAWSRQDAAAAVLPEVEEDMDFEKNQDVSAIDPEAPILREVDMEELVSKEGLWLAVDGTVYDLTLFQKQHPGGVDVLQSCAGRDATAEFQSCPASKLPLASICRYQVGPLRLQPKEYRIFEHKEEEQRMQRLLVALISSLVLAAVVMMVCASQAVETRLIKEDASYGELLLPGSLLSTLVGVLSVLLPMRQKLGGSQCRAAGGWKAHAIALLLLVNHLLLPAALQSSWPTDTSPHGLELSSVALLLVEILLAPAMTPPVLPILLCLGSWYYRGLTASDCTTPGVYIPWRKAMVFAINLVMLTRLAQTRPAAARHGLALSALYGGAVCGWLIFASPEAATGLASPWQMAGLLVASATSLLAHCAVLDVAIQCSSRFATRWVAFFMAVLSFCTVGLSSFRWLALLGLFHHLLDLARHNRVRMDQVAAAGRFQHLDWHVIGAQALWDSSKVSILGFIWRTTVCSLQHAVTALIPNGLQVYACEVPVPNFGEKVAMGLAAQYVPPEARGKAKKPNFFVCNVGQILESCLPDMQHTMNTLVDVWDEFHEPKLPGLCANVVMVIPSSDQGLAKEINLSVWETGKDAFDWYVKSKGHKKALMQHTSGVLRTFGNLLASLEPKEAISYQDRCSSCARPIEASRGEVAPNVCGVCGQRAFRYNLF